MKLYRIKHKPTGLYFRPLKGKYTNFDVKGKVYDTKYAFNQLTNPAHTFFYDTLYFIAHKGKSKKKLPVEYVIGMKIHNGEISGLDIKNDRTNDDNVYIWMNNHPEDWEIEYIDVNITILNEQD